MTSLDKIQAQLNEIQSALMAHDGLYSHRQRVEQKLDALTAGVNSLLAGQQSLRMEHKGLAVKGDILSRQIVTLDAKAQANAVQRDCPVCMARREACARGGRAKRRRSKKGR